ncbi:MAG: hypothetical protein JXB50_00980 [Spirochaetes bacterium]|nr:hypothetical protein [Spirochaetota bacterium]
MDKIKIVLIFISAYTLVNINFAQCVSKEKQNDNIFTYDNYEHSYEYRNGVKENSKLVKKRIKMIEKIPDSVQEIVDNQGRIIIVFFNGCLTDNPDLISKKGVKPRGYIHGTFDKVMMCHYKSKLFIGVEGDYYDDGNDYTLHEYGHIYDDRAGSFFYGKPLSSLENVKNIINKKKYLLDKYYHHPREFIAFSVQNYYYSNYTRRYLKNRFHEIYEILKELEVKSVK